MKQRIYLFGNSIFVTFDFLFSCHLPKTFVYNHTSNKVKHPWVVRSHPRNRKHKLIDYCSIPYKILEEYKLPSYSELKDIAQVERKIIKEQSERETFLHIQLILKHEYSNWAEVRRMCNNIISNEKEVESLCKTHQVFEKILELQEIGFKLKDIHMVYCLFDDLVFQTEYYRSFCNKINGAMKADNLFEYLIHGLKGRASNNLKLTAEVITLIKELFSRPKKLNARQILKHINKVQLRRNKPEISLSCLYSVISKNYIKNECMKKRFGAKYYDDHVLPNGWFTPPQKEGTLWCMDGTKFQFAYKSHKNKINFLTYFIIIDAKSRCVNGYSVDKSENSRMVLQAFEMACKSKGYFPREIFCDESSAITGGDFERIIAQTKLWGVKWQIFRSRPKSNSPVERLFKTLQEVFCKEYDGYLGDGIKSRDLNARPSMEEIKKNLKRKKLRNRGELEMLIGEIIDKYNNSEVRAKLEKKGEKLIDKKSTNQVMPITFETLQYSRLFHATKAITVYHGAIIFTESKREYIYNIYDKEFLFNYHGQKVLVRYDRNDLSNILVFDLKTDEYLCSLKRFKRIPRSSFERTEEHNKQLHIHSSSKKRLIKEIDHNNQEITEEANKDIEVLPAEFAIGSSVKKRVRERNEEVTLEYDLKNIIGHEGYKVINQANTNKNSRKSKDLKSQKGSLKIIKRSSNG